MNRKEEPSGGIDTRMNGTDNVVSMFPHLAGPLFVDYSVAEECKNKDSYGVICVKCGECGRKFDEGIIIDEGGTHPVED